MPFPQQRVLEMYSLFALYCIHMTINYARNVKHRMSKHPAHSVWRDMRQRCKNPNDKAFANYGGRGISISPEWDVFETFWMDMKETWKPKLSLERKDVNGNYCKENCTWIPMSQQARNQRKTIKYKDKIALDMGKILGGHRLLVYWRLKNGWSKERAFTEPAHKYKKAR